MEQRKTTLQELITQLETIKSLSKLLTPDVITGINIAIEQCQRNFDVEKKEICLSFNQGYREGFSDAQHVSENEKDISLFEDANVYYKSTYGDVA